MNKRTRREVAHSTITKTLHSLVVCCSIPCAALATTADAEASLAQRLDVMIDAAVADGFAGGVAVLAGDEFLYDRVAGFADSSAKVPVDESTLFHVASITKYLTASLTLKAVEEGVLALEDSIDPLVTGTSLEGRGLTFQSLLAHRSGLGSSYAAERKSQPADALAAIAAAPWNEADGGQFKYSNDGYDLLGILLERAYGDPYEELARRKLLSPARLDHTGFWGETDLTDPTLVGQPLDRISRGLRKRNYGMISSAGLLITAADLARYQRALESGLLLAEESIRELWAERGAMSLGQATFGAFLVDDPRLGRVLSARGYEDWGDNAILNHYLDLEIIVAVVTSKGPAEGQGEPFRNRIAAAIESELVEEIVVGERISARRSER
jgi:CubicO group peptidase (beta-lactamase class C family)